ncbi:MAG: hypothetical protein R3C59_05330 [Planctomycetaceae bacterium]
MLLSHHVFQLLQNMLLHAYAADMPHVLVAEILVQVFPDETERPENLATVFNDGKHPVWNQVLMVVSSPRLPSKQYIVDAIRQCFANNAIALFLGLGPLGLLLYVLIRDGLQPAPAGALPDEAVWLTHSAAPNSAFH